MSKISDLLVSITLFFTPTQNIISSSISLSIIIMPAQAKTRSKTRSKSKSIKPKVQREKIGFPNELPSQSNSSKRPNREHLQNREALRQAQSGA
jgi:hypothetical protein